MRGPVRSSPRVKLTRGCGALLVIRSRAFVPLHSSREAGGSRRPSRSAGPASRARFPHSHPAWNAEPPACSVPVIDCPLLARSDAVLGPLISFWQTDHLPGHVAADLADCSCRCGLIPARPGDLSQVSPVISPAVGVISASLTDPGIVHLCDPHQPANLS